MGAVAISNNLSAYVTSIPEEAIEKIKKKAKQADGAILRAEYYLGGERVGERLFDPSGELSCEYAFQNGVKHGWQYRWDSPGELLSAQPYQNGLPHGVAYQWGKDGRLIGSYEMAHGTGIDIWFQDWGEGRVDLHEVYYEKDGVQHGYEWHFFENRRLSEERHWQAGTLHGIERGWNVKGGMGRSYPKYWVRGERLSKAKYLKACKINPALTVYDIRDDQPFRIFPEEIEKHLPKE